MKTIRLNDAIAKRLAKEGGQQPRHGRCVICGDDWDECPHNRVQTGLLEEAYRLQKVLPLTRR